MGKENYRRILEIGEGELVLLELAVSWKVVTLKALIKSLKRGEIKEEDLDTSIGVISHMLRSFESLQRKLNNSRGIQ